jgi:hypothetical protein
VGQVEKEVPAEVLPQKEDPLLCAGGAEEKALARERAEVVVATVGTADAGDALIPIAAEAEGGDGVNDERKAELIYLDNGNNETLLAENTATSACESTYVFAGGGGGGRVPPQKVICRELHRQGLMDEKIFEADEAFGRYLRDNHRDVLQGYQLWAKPVVKWMQKSETVTKVVAFTAKPWSYEMAYRMEARDKGTFVGKILMDVGIPVCRTIGRVVLWAANAGSLEDPCR